MNLYNQGDFNIKDSWNQQQTPETSGKNNNNNKTRETPTNKNLNSQAKPPTPDKSVLNRAAMALLTSNNEKKSEGLNLDQLVQNKVLNNLRQDMNPAGFGEINRIAKNSGNPVLKRGPQEKSPSISNRNQGKDGDLVSIMAARLSQVELLANRQREELKEKMTLISSLNDEIATLKMAANRDSLEDIKALKNENLALKKKLNEMEEFLLKYGIKWVGKEVDNGAADQRMKQILNDISAQKPIYNYNLPKEIDMDVILRRIEELNIIMEKEGATHVVKKDGAHRIKKMDPYPIGFYSNGIAMKGFKFFPYGSKDASQVLADILDGYFPYQLKRLFPDGTLLKVIDKVDEAFTSEKVGGNINDINNIYENELKPQSKEEFLNQLPKNVIQNGKVIPVRDEIQKKLEGGGKPVVSAQGVTLKEGIMNLETEISIKEQANQLSDGEKNKITTLKVRTESGRLTLIVKLLASDKIQRLYELLSPYSESGNFEIASNFPNRSYDKKLKENLEELGFFPNAALHLKQREK